MSALEGSSNGDVQREGEAEEESDEKPEEEEGRRADETITLCLLFFAYLLTGAAIISSYEPEMRFFEAFYFNFVTLTTIGLGDFVPRR